MLHLGLNERDVERVLAGHQPHGRPDMAEVAYLFARLRTLRDFEQAPPMSPKLLAELDASEAARREDELARERARRNRAMRRRWRTVGTAAAVTMLGGLFVLAAHLSGQARQPGVDVESPNTTRPADEPVTSSTVPSTQPPQTTTTTAAPPQTTTPPATEPPETTQQPQVLAEEGGPSDREGPSDGYGPGPWPGPPPDGGDWDEGEMREWIEWCARNPGPYQAYCQSYWEQMYANDHR